MKSNPNDLATDSSEFKSIGKTAYNGFKDYWKLFVGAFLFAVISFFACLIIIILIVGGILHGLHITRSIVNHSILLRTAIYVVVLIPSMILYDACLGSLYGISRDIIATGDYYANVKSALFYFRKYWWKYIIGTGFVRGASTLLFLIFYFLIIVNTGPILYINLLVFGINVVWETLFIMIMPSISTGNSLKKAFRECLHLIRFNFRKLFKIYGLIYLILQAITLIYTFVPASEINLKIVLAVFALLVNFVFVPLLAMIATLLYYKFTRVPINSQEST